MSEEKIVEAVWQYKVFEIILVRSSGVKDQDRGAVSLIPIKLVTKKCIDSVIMTAASDKDSFDVMVGARGR